MSIDFSVECPSCGETNVIDILAADHGSKILCKRCKSRIIVKFEGKSLKETVNEINESLKKAFEGRC